MQFFNIATVIIIMYKILIIFLSKKFFFNLEKNIEKGLL